MAKNFYAKEVYLLSGLIECGECGSKMNGNISYYNKNGEKLRYVMYRCTGKGTSAKDYIKVFQGILLRNTYCQRWRKLFSVKML